MSPRRAATCFKASMGRLLRLAVGLGTLSACTPTAVDPSGLPDVAKFRAGYTVVKRTDGNDSYHQQNTLVSDVSVRGDLIVVSATRMDANDYTGGGGLLIDPNFTGSISSGSLNKKLVYFVSRDRGASWVEHELVLPPLFIPSKFAQLGIALSDDGAIATVGSLRTRADDAVFYFDLLGLLDLDTGVWHQTYEGELHGRVWEEDGIVYEADIQSQDAVAGALGGYGNYYWLAVQAATGATQAGGSSPYSPTDCRLQYLSPMGKKFGGFCFQFSAVGSMDGQVCYAEMDPGENQAPVTLFCMPAAVGDPIANAGPDAAFRTGNGPMTLYEEGSHTMGIVSHFGMGPTYDLGEGKPRRTTSRGFHDAFHDMAVVQTDTGISRISRIYEFEWDDPAPYALPVAKTPCRVDGDCPDGTSPVVQLAWLQRTGLDEHLAIYDIRTETGQMLVFGREKGLRTRASDELSTCATPPDATALWTACYGEHLCGLNEVSTCLLRWSEVRGRPGAADPALQAFLAANPGDCSALLAVDPAAAPTPYDQGSGTCTARCDGDVAVACSAGDFLDQEITPK